MDIDNGSVNVPATKDTDHVRPSTSRDLDNQAVPDVTELGNCRGYKDLDKFISQDEDTVSYDAMEYFEEKRKEREEDDNQVAPKLKKLKSFSDSLNFWKNKSKLSKSESMETNDSPSRKRFPSHDAEELQEASPKKVKVLHDKELNNTVIPQTISEESVNVDMK